MSDVRQYMNKVNGWEKMDTAMTANQLTGLVNLPKLRDRSQRVRSLYARHAALAAERQAITQEMQELIEEGDQLFRSAKEMLREHYGKRNEKLVEFGVEPLRTATVQRRRSKKSTEPTPEIPVSPAPVPDSVK